MTVVAFLDQGTWPDAAEHELPPVFRLVPHSEISIGSDAVYLVKGIIPRVGVMIVWGAPKCGKTFVTHDLAMHVALGWEYRGRRVKQGTVVYFAAEGATGFRARVEAYRRRRLVEEDQPAFFMIDATLALIKDHPELIRSIRIGLDEQAPAMVVIDTLNRTYTGSESSDEDMTAYVNAAHAIKTAFACAVVVVHHSGLDTTRMRGHTALLGAADASLSVKRDAADRLVLAVEAMKDGPTGDEFTSKLEIVDVGLDEDGEPITSCIIEATAEEKSGAYKADRAASLTPAAKVALSALHEAIDIVGTEPPKGIEQIPRTVRKVVTKAEWRTFAVKRGISTSDKDAAVRNALDRASVGLVAAKRIGVWENHVWPA